MAPPVPKVTLREYLAGEEASDRKHEFFGGEVFEMEAASVNHSRIAGNLYVHLRTALHGSGCEALITPRTATAENGLYTYPDLIVVCGKVQVSPANPDTVTNPRLIIEVLSPSTEGYDRGKKFDLYRQLPSFVEYLTVAQEAPWVLHHILDENGEWRLRPVTGMEAALRLVSIPVEMPLRAVYESVDFASSKSRDPKVA